MVSDFHSGRQSSYKLSIFLKVCFYFQMSLSFDNAKIAFRVPVKTEKQNQRLAK